MIKCQWLIKSLKDRSYLLVNKQMHFANATGEVLNARETDDRHRFFERPNNYSYTEISLRDAIIITLNSEELIAIT